MPQSAAERKHMDKILEVQGLKKTFKLSAKQQKIEKTKEKVKVAVSCQGQYRNCQIHCQGQRRNYQRVRRKQLCIAGWFRC